MFYTIHYGIFDQLQPQSQQALQHGVWNYFYLIMMIKIGASYQTVAGNQRNMRRL
jgi:hypothetical protein